MADSNDIENNVPARSGPRRESVLALPPGPDLVTDGELFAASDDEFQAQHLVAELVSVIDGHDPGRPANIALYGPWGSGKSSIARLLENEYDPDHAQQLRPTAERRSTAFVRFDAFKYAGHSLRRNFLLKVAEGLKQRSGLEEQLYSSVTARRVKLSWANAWTAAWQVLLFIVAPTILAAVLGAMLWAGPISEMGLWDGTREVFPEVLAILSVPAAAGLFALMREVLPSTVTTSSPSSEEQFEEHFDRLVRSAGKDRVVIFVDEIDRCAPSEVVETLDTIRTFLDVEGCIVIVAADQRVLERALSDRVRQTTPEDTTNPYYSSGSAYLDKVFHYQFSIPPLLPAVISQYALKLTEDKGGVWAAVDRESVISVLIPTHVRSPRRVKALLNNFVLTYRLAIDRNVGGDGSRALSARASELAVLVCLRSEFPLFARDLPQFPVLPTLVRWLHSNDIAEARDSTRDGDDGQAASADETQTTRPKATAAAWELAERYCTAGIAADTPLSPVDVDQRASENSDDESGHLVRAIRDDLVGYLSKTAYIKSPSTDLIYLTDSTGFFGLEADMAEELASLAHNAERKKLREAIAELDAGDQASSLRFLAHRTRETAFGEDGSNMASSLLVAVAAAGETAVSSSVNDVVTAVEQQQQRNRLRRSDLPGALAIGLRSDRPQARDLTSAVMESEAYEADGNLALAILRNSTALSETHAREVYEAAGWALIHESGMFVDALQELAQDDSAALLRDAGPTIAQVLNNAMNPPSAPPPEMEVLEPDRVRESAGDVLDRLLASDNRILAEILAAGFVGIGEDAPTLGIVAERSAEFVSASTAELASAALTAALARPWNEAADWARIANSQALSETERGPAVDQLTEKLWAGRAEEAESPEAFGDALQAVRELATTNRDRDDQTRSLIAPAFESTSSDEVNVTRLSIETRIAELFVEAGLVDAEVVGEVLASTMAGVLANPLPAARPGRPTPPSDKQQTWIAERAVWIAEHATGGAEPLLDSMLSSTWMPAPQKELLALRAAVAADVTCPIDETRIAELIQQYPADPQLAELLTIWLTDFESQPDDVYAIARPYLDGELPDRVAAAIRAWADQASSRQRAEAALPALAVLPAKRPSQAFLEATRANDADESLLAEELVRLCSDTGRWNPVHRANVLQTWRQLSPTSRQARTTLLRGIAVPFIDKSGHTAALELLDYSDLLASPPSSVRDELRSAFRRVTDGKPRERALRDMLDSTGIDKRPLLEKATDWLTGRS